MSKRVVKEIAGVKVITQTRQVNSVAHCETCNWHLETNNSMGVAARHAAAKRHLVLITREMVTEYNGLSAETGMYLTPGQDS